MWLLWHFTHPLSRPQLKCVPTWWNVSLKNVGNPTFEKYDDVTRTSNTCSQKNTQEKPLFKVGQQEEAPKEFTHVLRDVLLRSGLGPAGRLPCKLDLMIALTALHTLVLSVSWISDVCGPLLLLFAAKGLHSSKQSGRQSSSFLTEGLGSPTGNSM